MKQVPATSKVDIDPETGAMKRMSGETRTNPYDLFALETALAIREKTGGTVTVLTMGPSQAEEMIRDAYTMGADEGVILSDRKFAGADVLATSYALAQGIQVIGGADLIICGRQTTDGDTAQVGPAIAEHLTIPHAAWVAEIMDPVTFELIGEARKMAVKVGYQVNCVIVGGKGTKENAEKLLPYGVDNVYVYEHEGFEGFRADCYTDAVADCIAANKPSSVLIGATALGRSLAPRLSTRFHTGLTADCTTLDIRSNTDMIQIRPAFGGNIMAQIGITKSRPQFATVRYKVMDKAEKVKNPHGQVVVCPVNEKMADSRIKILSSRVIDKVKSLEEEDVLVVAGRGVRNEKDVEMCRELADALGGQLAFTRPMVENGFGDVAHQIGLSGRTVRPKLIITCGVSGAIQFTSCMTGSDCIVAINNDPEAQIFNVADYCIVDDLYQVVPELTELIKNRKED